MQFMLKFALIAFLTMPDSAFAQSPSMTKASKIPGGHDQFLTEFHALLKKYPNAAARFGLTDLSKFKKKPIQTPSGDARFACCDFPDPMPTA